MLHWRFSQEDQEPNQQLCPRVWPSGGTFMRDFHVDFESEHTQEVVVVRWTSPLSPSGAAKQVSQKDPRGCVCSKKKQANDPCLVNSCLLWWFTESTTSDFYHLLCESCIFMLLHFTRMQSKIAINLNFSAADWKWTRLYMTQIKTQPSLAVC